MCLALLFVYLLFTPALSRSSIPVFKKLAQDTLRKDISLIEQIPGEDSSIKSIEQYIELNQALPAEKIFLHLDRPNYMQGDTIWFKAYSWVGSGQVPDTLSRVLYVDLVGQDGKTGLKRKLLIENGTSRGDFILDTIMPSGVYTLRAYTRWMQNGKNLFKFSFVPV
jgi:uncharacterized protein YfaS (alpha-2-macroglobulin family)